MEIKKRSLIKYSLIGFIQIFIFLTLIESRFEPKEYEIHELTLKHINKNIILKGTIQNQNLINQNLFLEIRSLNSNNKIKAIVFRSNQTFPKNNNYKFEGKITYYKKELELIINKIELI